MAKLIDILNCFTINTNTPYTLVAKGSAALAAAVGLLRYGDPHFPQEINEAFNLETKIAVKGSAIYVNRGFQTKRCSRRETHKTMQLQSDKDDETKP